MTSPAETTYNIQITKALNGWIVRTMSNSSVVAVATPISTMLVTDDKDLPGMIAAALMDGRLHGEAPMSPQEVRYHASLAASPTIYNAYAAQNAAMPAVTATQSHIKSSLLRRAFHRVVGKGAE